MIFFYSAQCNAQLVDKLGKGRRFSRVGAGGAAPFGFLRQHVSLAGTPPF